MAKRHPAAKGSVAGFFHGMGTCRGPPRTYSEYRLPCRFCSSLMLQAFDSRNPVMTDVTPHTILVVEDDAIVRMLIVDVLEELEYRVIEAEDGEQAIEVLKDLAQAVQMMMTDVGLPGVDGYELARQALALRPGLPILIASGYGDSVSAPAGSQVLGKPFSIDDLRDKVQEMLG
jgi:CheY-like chemotaxis protein